MIPPLRGGSPPELAPFSSRGKNGPLSLSHRTVADPQPTMRYIGVLQPLAEDAAAEVVPVVADSVPMLELTEVLAGPSAVELMPQQSAPKRQPQIWKTHYVCTGKGCGWSGSARTRHAERKPNCPFVPCPMSFRAGEKAAPLVKEYLAKCTEAQARLAPLAPRLRPEAPHAHAFASPAQREHGLPPDRERALRLNETQLVVTIPEGCKPGDSFDVRMEFGARAPHACGMHRVARARCGGGTRRFI